jgi:hypothetical protein
MRRLRYDERLACHDIAERFGCSVDWVRKLTRYPKPGSDLRERWTLMLPDMIAAVKAAAERA